MAVTQPQKPQMQVEGNNADGSAALACRLDLILRDAWQKPNTMMSMQT